MKSKIDTILDKVQKSQAARLDAENRVRQLEKQQADLQTQMDAAETSEEYLKLQDDMRPIQADLFIAKKQMQRIDLPCAPEEVREAWADYANSYNKRLRAGLKAYLAARKELGDMYRELCEDQAAALGVRETCGKLLGIDTNITGLDDYDSLFRDFEPLAHLPMEEKNIMNPIIRDRGPIAWQCSDDATFWTAIGMLDINRFTPVFRQHRSHN